MEVGSRQTVGHELQLELSIRLVEDEEVVVDSRSLHKKASESYVYNRNRRAPTGTKPFPVKTCAPFFGTPKAVETRWCERRDDVAVAVVAGRGLV